MKDEIKIKITKVARRTCDKFLNPCGCLLATALKRKGFKEVGVRLSSVRIGLRDYKISHPEKIKAAYYEPESAFKPFDVTLTPL